MPSAKQRTPPSPKKKTPPGPSDLQLWWPFDDGPRLPSTLDIKVGLATGTRFTSASNYGQLAYPAAGPGGAGAVWQWEQAMGGWVYNNIAGQHAQSANNSEITFKNFGGPFNTCSLWAKLVGTIATSKATVIHKEFNFPTNLSIALQIDQATNLWEFAYTVSGTMKTLQSTKTVVTGRWYHLVGIWDGTTQRFYIDGVQVASQATGNPDVNGSIWSVGDRDSNDNPFKGRIWNVQFYTRALKPNEVEMLFLNPTAAVNPPRPDPPVPGGGGTPPPPPTAAASGALIYGRPATPVPHRNIIISNHSGQKPLLQ